MATNPAKIITNACRACLTQLSTQSAIVSLDCAASDSDPVTLRSKLQSCVPEMNLALASSSALCGQCTAAVEHGYKFRKKCLETEEQIRKLLQPWKATTTKPELHFKQLPENLIKQEVCKREPGATCPSAEPDVEFVPEPTHNPQIHLEIINTNFIQFNTDAVAQESVEGVDADMLTNSVARYKKRRAVRKDKSLYRCHNCSYRTKHRPTIILHMRVHASTESYKCKHCSFKTSCKTRLKQHEFEKHIGKDIFKCKKCAFTTQKAAVFMDHTRKHEKHPLFCCSHCDFYTTNGASLTVHRRNHAAEPATVYSCNTCKILFHTESGFNEHRKIHITESPDIICLD